MSRRCRICVFGRRGASGNQTSGKLYAGPSAGITTYSQAPTSQRSVLDFVNVTRGRRSRIERNIAGMMLNAGTRTVAYVSSKKRTKPGDENSVTMKTVGA